MALDAGREAGADQSRRLGPFPRSRAQLHIWPIGIGAIAGGASGLLGVGGGFLIVPLLAIAKVDPRRLSGTSLAAILPIGVVGAARYYFGVRTPQVDIPVAILLMLGSVAGAYGGARLAGRVPRRVTLAVIGASLAVVGVDEIAGRFLVPNSPIGSTAALPLTDLEHGIAMIAVGAAIGLLSGLTGVGGGIFLVPALVFLFGVGQHVAQGTSLVAILPTALVGALTHWRRGNVDVSTAIVIGSAGAPAALLGASLAIALTPSALAPIFGGFLVIAAGRMLLEARNAPARAPSPRRVVESANRDDQSQS